ncbi:MAG: hypothetical protein HF982_02470 [Desulfobacteraceae bacterium]|nr:hypothetical protein [Desulfobacteraceae bacterium]MBC2718455.1 hypothetical protein [Desulfobacteraceae bacterium]
MTSSTENKKNVIAEIERYRTKIRKNLLSKLLEKRNLMEKEGKYFYEGKWLDRAKIVAFQEAAKRRDRIIFLEISALFLFIIATILGLLKGLTAFLLPM